MPSGAAKSNSPAITSRFSSLELAAKNMAQVGMGASLGVSENVSSAFLFWWVIKGLNDLTPLPFQAANIVAILQAHLSHLSCEWGL